MKIMKIRNNFSFICYLSDFVSNIIQKWKERKNMRFDKIQNITDEKAKEIVISHLEKKISRMNHSEIFELFRSELEFDDDIVVFYVTGLPKVLKESDFSVFAKGHTATNKEGFYFLIEQVANDSLVITKYIRKKEKTPSKKIGYKVQIKATDDGDLIALLNTTDTKSKEIKSMIKNSADKLPVIYDSGVW